jgi:hypothetical protein
MGLELAGMRSDTNRVKRAQGQFAGSARVIATRGVMWPGPSANRRLVGEVTEPDGHARRPVRAGGRRQGTARVPGSG